jgi:hypothetical protein
VWRQRPDSGPNQERQEAFSPRLKSKISTSPPHRFCFERHRSSILCPAPLLTISAVALSSIRPHTGGPTFRAYHFWPDYAPFARGQRRHHGAGRDRNAASSPSRCAARAFAIKVSASSRSQRERSSADRSSACANKDRRSAMQASNIIIVRAAGGCTTGRLRGAALFF